ncbi:cold shock CspA family protein [Brevundimonas variabilis]|uniref:Cold shock CspA family protein n=2 Tax=Brevundimonas variabilis TaxID=74312 RepID=A0A7W9CFW2_9CAUL|nr:cold shock CspA family protein [Brevundimonas variabilis]
MTLRPIGYVQPGRRARDALPLIRNPVDRFALSLENAVAVRISRGVQTRVSLLRLNELSRWTDGFILVRTCLEKRVYGERSMATGTVKWFNPTKGFGFIQPESGGADVFVHITAVQKAGLQGLDENAKVEYELESQRGKTSAVNLKVL